MVFLALGLKIDIMAPNNSEILTIIILFFTGLYIVIMTVLSVPGVIKDMMWQSVVDDRGKGNWKVVDDDKWDKFYTMCKLVEEREKERLMELGL